MNCFSQLRVRLYSAGFRADHLGATVIWLGLTIFCAVWTRQPIFLILNIPLALIYVARLIP